MGRLSDFDPGWFGWIFTAITICFFKFLSKWSAQVFNIPPGIIRGYGDDYRIFRWRNLVISFLHAVITGSWSLVCVALYGKYMRQDMVAFVNWPTYGLCCFTTGYFLYDAADIVLARRIMEKWDILLHHMTILISASYVVTYAECVGYQAFGMLVEVNTIFLHRRQMFQLAGIDRWDPSVRMNTYVNLLTFVIFRCFPLTYLTVGIFYDGHRVPFWYLSFYGSCMALLNVINIILLYRLFQADVFKSRNNAHSNPHGHKKANSTSNLPNKAAMETQRRSLWNGHHPIGYLMCAREIGFYQELESLHMATTLTVDQAVHRLIHGAARPVGNESRLITIRPSQNIEHRRNAINTGIFASEKSPSTNRGSRNGSNNSRYSTEIVGGMAAAANRISADPYFVSFQRRGKSNGGPINVPTARETDELNDGVSMRELFPTPTSDSVMDVQRYLRSFIVTQANRLSREQQISAAKDREIEELRRENNALRYALRSFEKRLPTINVAQQCDLPDIVETKYSNAQQLKTVSSQSDVDTKQAAPTSALGERERDSPERNLETKKTRKRTRRSADTLARETGKAQALISNRLRSGRQRSINQPEPRSQLKKRRRQSQEAEPIPPKRLTGRRSTARNGNSGNGSKNRDDVQTPGWRILQFSIGSALEGTENITDEAFSKRHQKCEVEERRVIRRDKMRQREELLKERMVRGEHHNRLAKPKRDRSDSESSAAAPAVDQLETIEICDHLPKSALSKLPTTSASPPAKKRKHWKK